MKKLMVTGLVLFSLSAFASNYPSDYCHAHVRICTDGPGVVAQVSSGCNSGVYVIGYKKDGLFGDNSFVDAVVNFKFGNYSTVGANFRVTPDWNNLGFLTPGINVWTVVGRAGSGPVTEISIAYSNGSGGWDSNYGANYNFPVGDYRAANCYNVKTNDDYTSQVPYSAWDVINTAMSR